MDSTSLAPEAESKTTCAQPPQLRTIRTRRASRQSDLRPSFPAPTGTLRARLTRFESCDHGQFDQTPGVQGREAWVLEAPKGLGDGLWSALSRGLRLWDHFHSSHLRSDLMVRDSFVARAPWLVMSARRQQIEVEKGKPGRGEHDGMDDPPPQM